MQTCTYALPTLHFVGGTSGVYSFHFVNKNRDPMNCKGQMANFSVSDYSSRDRYSLISKNFPFAQDNAGVESVVHIELTSNDTKYLHGKYIYQLTIIGEDNNSIVPSQGILYIDQNINPTVLI